MEKVKLLMICNEDGTFVFEMGCVQDVVNEEVRILLEEGSVGDRLDMELIEMTQEELDALPEY